MALLLLPPRACHGPAPLTTRDSCRPQVCKLRYTPRKFIVHPDAQVLVVAEADHQAVPLAKREDLSRRQQEQGTASRGPELDAEAGAAEEQFGGPKGSPGQWASCVRVINPRTMETNCVIELEDNEAAVSMCLVTVSRLVPLPLDLGPCPWTCALAPAPCPICLSEAVRESRTPATESP